MNLNLTKITDYLLVYLLIAFSGVPFFYRAEITMMMAAMLLPACVFLFRRKKVHKFIFVYITIALVVQLLQMLKFNFLPLNTFLGLHLRILFAYMVLAIVGSRFMKLYIDLLVISVIISLFFYFFIYIPAFESLMVNKVAPLFENPFIKESNYKVWPNIILYTFNSQGEGITLLKRNSGPFWEPGAFAGFLTLAILFEIIRTGSLWTRKNRILIFGLITTFSTTGIIVLMFIVMSFIYVRMQLGGRLILIPLVLTIGVISFQSVDFLGKKIKSKMSYDMYSYNTRFKSAAIDLKDFVDNPLVGVGRSSVTRYQGQQLDRRSMHRNNGVTNHLAMYGIFYFIAYFFMIYQGYKTYCMKQGINAKFALFCIISIFLIGFSEIYFNKVLFYALTMLHFIIKDSSNEESADPHSIEDKV